MLVLGIETSCDETGVALVDSAAGLVAQALHSQIDMHRAYGGVVPELASRDHIARVLPLIESVLVQAGRQRSDIDAIAVTAGPGLAGALLVGASIGHAIGVALGRPVIDVHHLEGHLVSPLLADPAPALPYVALLVSGGHTQLLRVERPGAYELLGETLDDAAGEAFDKTAKLLGLPYPGGPALAQLAESGRAGAFTLPRPMLASGDLDMSFSGLKTAVATLVRRVGPALDAQARADVAREFESAVVDVLVAKALAALEATGQKSLVVAGGVGANRSLRKRLSEAVARRRATVHFPDLAFCTDNGAMIALAGALRVGGTGFGEYAFGVRPRWPLTELAPAS
jgi:N6-L-threonylcarbamoyladenine synthase